MRLILASANDLGRHAGGKFTKEKPPQVGRGFEAHGLKRFHPESKIGQAAGGFFKRARYACFHGHTIELRHQADPHAPEIGLADRNWCGEWIRGIITGQHAEQEPQILGIARHGSCHSDQSSGVVHFRHMAGGGNSSRRWLESGDAREMGGNANGSAAIAANATRRKERGNCRRLAAARSARSALQIPRIVGAAGDIIVGFVVGEKLGTVGLANRNRPGLLETRHGSCIVRGTRIGVEAAAASGGKPSHVEAVLDTDGDAV